MTTLIGWSKAIRFSRWAGWLAVLLLALSASVAVTEESQAPAPPGCALPAPPESTAGKSPWGRIVMVGASATAGFTESEPMGGPTTQQYRLSRYLDAALLVPHKPARNLAHAMFFLQPEAVGRDQIDEALKARPTLVVGIDFLFWFCYGDGPTDKDRLRRFEKGLKLIEAVRCPLILGDIPDASGATNGMLQADQVPSVAAMSAANRRLKEWAATRPQVVIVSLSGFMRSVMANQAFTIHGQTLPEGTTRVLLQSDQLHPSRRGCAVLALVILDAFQSTRPAGSAGDVRWDPKEVLRLGVNPPHGPAGNRSEIP